MSLQTLQIKASLIQSKAELDALSDILKQKYPQIYSVEYWFDPMENTDISPDWLRKSAEFRA